MKDIGTFQSIPQVVNDINNGNVTALNEHLAQGWDINKEIRIDKYTRRLPINHALIMECFESVVWLVEHGADLNIKGNNSFLIAVRHCNEKIVRYIADHGAKLKGVNAVKAEAYEQAFYGKRYENLPLIHELGYSVGKYAGETFRMAVSDQNYAVIEFFIDHGVDINYNKPDMVYPFKPTPLCVAARYVDLPMCKYLVEHGADVTLAEEDGMRPYSIALEKGDLEMAEYFKALEPPEYHSMQNKLKELESYNLPKSLIDFLQGENLHFDLPETDFEFIDFFSLNDTIPMKVGRRKLLRLSRTTGDYDHIYILWNPTRRKIAFYDMEMEEFGNLGRFEDFVKEPAVYMQKIMDGDWD